MESEDAAKAMAPFVRPKKATAVSRRRAVGVAAFALLVALIAVPWAVRRAGDVEIQPYSIGILDRDSGS